MRDVPNIDDVLLPQRLVEPKFPVVLGHHGVDVALGVAALRGLLRELRSDRVAAREPGQDEVDCRRNPDDDNEEDQATEEVAEAHLLVVSRESRVVSQIGINATAHDSRLTTPDSSLAGWFQLVEDELERQVPEGAVDVGVALIWPAGPVIVVVRNTVIPL